MTTDDIGNGGSIWIVLEDEGHDPWGYHFPTKDAVERYVALSGQGEGDIMELKPATEDVMLESSLRMLRSELDYARYSIANSSFGHVFEERAVQLEKLLQEHPMNGID